MDIESVISIYVLKSQLKYVSQFLKRTTVSSVALDGSPFLCSLVIPKPPRIFLHI